MNELVAKFSDKLVILGFPCNQFGHQENSNGEEIYNSLKYVRPGNMYEPKFALMEKCNVNGSESHPVFSFLRQSLSVPSDEPDAFMANPKLIIWSPVSRTDIAWNFEKFLIAPDGVPYKRYSRRYETINIQSDIQELIEKYKV
ncbi:glutathione peroxidase gpx1 [Mactra antiquata]